MIPAGSERDSASNLCRSVEKSPKEELERKENWGNIGKKEY